MAEQADKEILKLFESAKHTFSVSDILSFASEIRLISKSLIGDMLEKVEGIVNNLTVSKTVDSSGATKRKFEAVGQDSAAVQQDAKVRKTGETPESGSDATASKGDADGWACASCTFVNHPSLEVCEMCDNSRYAFAMLQMQLEDMKQKSGFVEPPINWQPVDPGTRLRRVKLEQKDVDFVEIVKVMSACGFETSSSIFNSIANLFVSKRKSPYNIIQIERIENLHLYQMYSIKKSQMQEENGPLVQNEKMLWHGTAPECVDSIASYGFNRSHCGKNGTAYGKGVYFSTGPCYSSHQKYAKPDKSGHQYMFYTRVLTGRHTLGTPDMVEPPMFLNKLGRFNSVADTVQHPGIFVIFHDAQAYPEFLVTFKEQ